MSDSKPVDIEEIAGTCACFYMRRAAREVTSLFDTRLAPVNLRSTQFVVLVLVRLQQPIQVGELAQMLGLNQTAMSRSLKPLQDRKLIKAQETPEDKRVKHVTLTAKGKRLLEKATPYWREAQSEVTALFGEDGWTELQQKLARTTQLATKEVKSSS